CAIRVSCRRFNPELGVFATYAIGGGANNMSFNTTSVLLLIGVFAGMLLSLIIGQRLGRREKDVGTDSGRIQLTAVEAAIFGLMGLMVAFTFSGAAQRYEMRRQLVVDEANA